VRDSRVSTGRADANDSAVEAAFSISEIGPEINPQARMVRARIEASKILNRRDIVSLSGGMMKILPFTI